MALANNGERFRRQKHHWMISLAMMVVLLAPAMASSSRLWQATECTMCAVSERATRYYEVVRFAYLIHLQVEKAAGGQ